MTAPIAAPTEAPDGLTNALLELRDIRVALDAVPVLNGVDLAVGSGEVVGLVGPNGAGKSTLLRAATRIVPLAGGEVRVAGDPLDALSRRDLARRIAVVQQLPEAPTALHVRDLVLLGRNPHLRLLARESNRDLEIVEQSLRQAGCQHLAGRELGTLSGGERRRAFIARALAQQAPLLLLDEPTANLDTAAQHEVLDLVAGLAASGAGVLLVIHDLTLAAAYCDRIVLLDHGRVAAAGSPIEVIREEVVRGVYGPLVSVLTHPDTGAPIIVPTRLEHPR